MQLRLVALNKKKSGAYTARKVIPADVRQAYVRLYGRQWEEKLHLPADTLPAFVKKRCGEWCAEIETRIATLRAEAKGEGQPLTRRNSLALAGEWYSWFIAKHEDAPGQPSRRRQLSDNYFWEFVFAEAPPQFRADPARTPIGNGRMRRTCARS